MKKLVLFIVAMLSFALVNAQSASVNMDNVTYAKITTDYKFTNIYIIIFTWIIIYLS